MARCVPALILSRKIGDKNAEATILNNIGGIYDQLYQNEKALEYFVEALTLYQTVGDKHSEANTIGNIGRTYLILKKYQPALEKGYHFYLTTFFGSDGTPRYYNYKTSPLDIQCASQGIQTLVNLRRLHPAIAFLICFNNSACDSTGLNCGNSFFTFSGAWMRKPTCASSSMAVSL